MFFAIPGSKHACPNSAACWSPAMPLTGTESPAATSGSVVAEAPAARQHRRAGTRAGRRTGRTARRTSRAVDVVQHRAARVRRVGRVHAAVGTAAQPPQDPAVDGAEHRGRRRPSTPPCGEQPLELGRREVGVEHEAGQLADQRLAARFPELVAARRGAPVLPDDGAVAGVAGAPVPHDRGLALVGDADARRRSRRRASPATSARVAMVASQISSASCSTQPGWGKCCGNSRYAQVRSLPVLVDGERAHAGRPGVDREGDGHLRRVGGGRRRTGSPATRSRRRAPVGRAELEHEVARARSSAPAPGQQPSWRTCTTSNAESRLATSGPSGAGRRRRHGAWKRRGLPAARSADRSARGRRTSAAGGRAAAGPRRSPRRGPRARSSRRGRGTTRRSGGCVRRVAWRVTGAHATGAMAGWQCSQTARRWRCASEC